MTIENKIVSIILKYLWVKYPCLMKDIVIPEGSHLHKNWKRKEVYHEV